MKNCMNDIAKTLGVEIGEVFKVDSKPSRFFRFTYKSLQISAIADIWIGASDDDLYGLLDGSLPIHKLFWKPRKRETYYCPNIFSNALYSVDVWNDDVVDKEFYVRGLVFRTKEEAIAMSKRMIIISMTKERENNDR